ncbi:MAG: hypothetical protein VR64_09225 [Desulfatitalea sp. BRH_c12]|nr:MAG: hypothetical protein VR64_09225 [Desulfatitalea sp. BRH_c12]
MFFLIAGTQPKTKTIDSAPRRCPQCGLHQAVRQQVDYYISLFFIPLIRIKQGKPFLYCRHCRQPVGDLPQHPAIQPPSGKKCGACGADVNDHFLYCPHCGNRQ